MTKQTFDLVLLGATGFTGDLVARYLASAAAHSVRWAIAGRNRDKLSRLKQELVKIAPHCEQVGIIIVDMNDSNSLRKMASASKVLLNTAGPFSLHGMPVVRACVAEGADYLDISGEAAFIHQLEEELAGMASAAGVRIVSCCGFEALVADLGTLFTLQHLTPDKVIELRAYVRFSGSLSGGSLQTALNAMSDLANNTLPVPIANGQRRIAALRPSLGRNRALGGWVAPMPMIDQDMVLRSAASSDKYGPDFSYAHHIVFPSLTQMLQVVGGLTSMVVFAQLPWTRRWMQKRLRQSGQGPSEEQRNSSWFKVRFDAVCGERKISTEVSGGDPGYGETAKMVAQAALCLFEDRDKLPPLAGLLTPAQAMGESLIPRLEHQGIRFQVL